MSATAALVQDLPLRDRLLPTAYYLISTPAHSSTTRRDRGEVGIGSELRVGDREHLPHRRAGHHRHAERLGLVEAQAHVLVRQPGREAEIERARDDRLRELVLRRAVASASGIDDVAAASVASSPAFTPIASASDDSTIAAAASRLFASFAICARPGFSPT